MNDFRSLLLLLLLLLLLIFPASPALALCPPTDPAALFQQADAVAYGRLGRIDPVKEGTLLTFVLTRVYKGELPNPVKVLIPAADPMAGANWRVEEEHTLFLNRGPGRWYQTGACAGTQPGPPAGPVAAVLGEGAPAPRIGLPERVWIPFTAIGITAAAIGAVLISIWRRRAE